MKNRPPHAVLPPEAIAALQRAAATPPVPEAREPRMARWAAIERATESIKSQYPHLFQEEQCHESETQ